MYDHRTAEPFRGSDAVAAGRVTVAMLRSRTFRRLGRDTYVGASAEIDTRLLVRALALRAGPGAVLAGPSAALAWGAECPWEGAEVIAATDLRLARDDIRRRVDRLGPGEVAWRWGVPCTTPLRTAWDLARRPPLIQAVAAVDALGHRAHFGPAALEPYLLAGAGARGVVLARRVVAMMDPLSDSLMESRARIGLVLRGVPRPVLQYPVRLPHGQRYLLDLAWPDPPSGRPTAIEYQGEEHRSPLRHGRDIDRAHVLGDLGWEIVEMTARQAYLTIDATAARIRRKLGV